MDYRFNVNVLSTFHRLSCDLDRIRVLSVHSTYDIFSLQICSGILSEMWPIIGRRASVHGNLTKMMARVLWI